MPPNDLLFLILGFAAGIVSVLSLRSTASGDQMRLARLENKVDLLLDKLGIKPDTPSDEGRDWLKRGMKINAIKAYRDQRPGIGLREAKDAVDALEAQMKAESFR